MFESCRAHPRLLAADGEDAVVGHLGAHIAERTTGDGARDAATPLVVPDDVVARARGLDLELAQTTVDVAAVVQAGDRLLAREAPFRERDVRLVETRLGGEDRFVELLAPGRSPRLDPKLLELV